MKKNLIIAAIAAALTTSPAAVKAAALDPATIPAGVGNIYAMTFMVEGVNYMPGADLYELTLTRQNGHTYRYCAEDGDWMIGDLAAAIMADMGTPEIIDDLILEDPIYCGWVDVDTWQKK